jgi:hypothetical protein
MAKSKRVSYFKARLEDKPGTLLAVAQSLKSKKIGLLGMWGYGTQPGQAELYCIPKDPDKFRSHMMTIGTTVEEGSGFVLKGSDKTGALVKTLDALAKAGVNIAGLHAIAAGGSYGAFLRVSAADISKTAEALGAK